MHSNKRIKYIFIQQVYAMALLVGAATFAPHTSAADGTSTNDNLPKCLYVSSYHQGYDWSDGVEQGVRSVLDGQCNLRQLDMDTKRKKTTEDKKLAAKTAYELIKSWKPDIVITSDDNAAKYLIVPYHKQLNVPFVFSGINWTVEEYGFPFPSVTGIVEVAPIEPMLKKAQAISGGSNAIYLGAATLTEGKNYSRIKAGADKMGIKMDKLLVSSMDEWINGFDKAQSADFIVMGSNSGIDKWSDEKAEAHAAKFAKILSVTNHAWMMNVTSLGFTKLPQEHGEWAAQASLAILNGASPNEIPIVTNRKWELWMNNELVDELSVTLPSNFSRKAKKIASID